MRGLPLKIFVCIKQVPDSSTLIKLKTDEEGIDDSQIEWVINPYDEFALEEALKIKEKVGKGEVCVFSLGPARVEGAVRTALAMGADKACLIETQTAPGPALTTQALATLIQREQEPPDLILTGKTGIDFNHSASGPLLAERLGLDHIGFVTHIEIKPENWLLCERQLHTETKEEIHIHLPALISVEKGINQPRYPSLPGIMKAKTKPIEKVSLAELNLQNLAEDVAFQLFQLPTQQTTPQILTGTAEEQAHQLIHILKEKEKII